jgi:hypothetical protein
METVLADAVPDEKKYITNLPNDDDRWSYAIRRLDREKKLMELINIVREYFKEAPKEEIEELYAFESARKTDVISAFDRLSRDLRFTGDYIVKLQEPDHPSLKELAALKDRLKNLYRSLHNLRIMQKTAEATTDEIAQVSGIEKHANMCSDRLQYYRTLLELSQPSEILPISEANAPGSLGDIAKDERVRLQAKAMLRNALVQLAEAVQAG